MDALKRAEKARQAEAAKDAEGPDGSDSQELSLDPLDDRSSADEEPAPRPSPPPPPPPPEESVELEFSLDDEEEEPPEPPAAVPGTHDTTRHLGPFSLLDDDEISTEDTGEMQPIARKAEEAVKEYFDETNSMSIALDDVRSVMDEDTVAGTQSVGSDELARQKAQSVFDAKTPPPRRRGRAALIFVPLFFVLFLGVSGFLLWDDLVKTFVGPPPLVSRQPPPVPVPSVAPPVAETAPAESGGAAPAVAQDSATASATGVAASGASEPVAAPAPDAGAEASDLGHKLAAAAQIAAQESGAAPVAATPASAAPESGDGSTGADAGGAAAPSGTASPPVDPETAGKIAELTQQALSGGGAAAMGQMSSVPSLRISKKTVPDQIHPSLQAAYEAFNSGDNARARSLYGEVLSRDPRNRNALLGIGAVAMRSGDIGEARKTYARLLQLNPGDPVARAALIDIQQDVSPVEGEGHVKMLLARNPAKPFLHATLGNLYARQARWPEAQQAYFDAFRLDSTNADYAFNLAVSLDRINQPAAALTYYRRALELAERGQASFETQAVLRRISSLGAAQSG